MKDTVKIKRFLKNYYADLKYQFDMEGIEYVNYNSCGTDEFHTEAECVAYMKSLKFTIDLLEGQSV